MSSEYALFTTALGLSAPWEVADVRFAPGSRFRCLACGMSDQPVHDTGQRSRQHLHFFERKAFIHAGVPRVRCGACAKTTQVEVPWARSGREQTSVARFSQDPRETFKEAGSQAEAERRLKR